MEKCNFRDCVKLFNLIEKNQNVKATCNLCIREVISRFEMNMFKKENLLKSFIQSNHKDNVLTILDCLLHENFWDHLAPSRSSELYIIQHSILKEIVTFTSNFLSRLQEGKLTQIRYQFYLQNQKDIERFADDFNLSNLFNEASKSVNNIWEEQQLNLKKVLDILRGFLSSRIFESGKGRLGDLAKEAEYSEWQLQDDNAIISDLCIENLTPISDKIGFGLLEKLEQKQNQKLFFYIWNEYLVNSKRNIKITDVFDEFLDYLIKNLYNPFSTCEIIFKDLEKLYNDNLPQYRKANIDQNVYKLLKKISKLITFFELEERISNYRPLDETKDVINLCIATLKYNKFYDIFGKLQPTLERLEIDFRQANNNSTIFKSNLPIKQILIGDTIEHFVKLPTVDSYHIDYLNLLIEKKEDFLNPLIPHIADLPKTKQIIQNRIDLQEMFPLIVIAEKAHEIYFGSIGKKFFDGIALFFDRIDSDDCDRLTNAIQKKNYLFEKLEEIKSKTLPPSEVDKIIQVLDGQILTSIEIKDPIRHICVPHMKIEFKIKGEISEIEYNGLYKLYIKILLLKVDDFEEEEKLSLFKVIMNELAQAHRCLEKLIEINCLGFNCSFGVDANYYIGSLEENQLHELLKRRLFPTLNFDFEDVSKLKTILNEILQNYVNSRSSFREKNIYCNFYTDRELSLIHYLRHQSEDPYMFRKLFNLMGVEATRDFKIDTDLIPITKDSMENSFRELESFCEDSLQYHIAQLRKGFNNIIEKKDLQLVTLIDIQTEIIPNDFVGEVPVSLGWAEAVYAFYEEVGRFPFPFELIFCSDSTSRDELDIIFWRLLNCWDQKIYLTLCIIFPGRLKQTAVFQLLKLLREINAKGSNDPNRKILIIEDKMNSIYKYNLSWTGIANTTNKIYDLSNELMKKFLIQQFERMKWNINCYYSNIVGVGRTHIILNSSKTKFVIQINDSSDIVAIITDLNDSFYKNAKEILIHVSAGKLTDMYLFQLFLLQGIRNNNLSAYTMKSGFNIQIELGRNPLNDNLRLNFPFASYLVYMSEQSTKLPEKISILSNYDHHPVLIQSSLSRYYNYLYPQKNKREDSTIKILQYLEKWFLFDSNRKQDFFDSQKPFGIIVKVFLNIEDSDPTPILLSSITLPNPDFNMIQFCLENKSEKELRELFCKFLFKVEIDRSNKIFWEETAFVLTPDNLLKLVVLYSFFQASIPVIFRGETGCGKTYLLEFLGKSLNKFKQQQQSKISLIRLIDLHPGFCENDIEQQFSEINSILSKSQSKNKVIIFFDEINNSPISALIKTAICDRRTRRVALHDQIWVTGACNPYRGPNSREQKSISYNVHPLPDTLEYFVWDFGSLNKENEVNYINSIGEQCKRENPSEIPPKIYESLSRIIPICQEFIRNIVDSPTPPSLRDIQRTFSLAHWFYIAYTKKSSPFQDTRIRFDKNKSEEIEAPVILSIACSYYFRLKNNERLEFSRILKERFTLLFSEYLQIALQRFAKCFKFDKYITITSAIEENLFLEFVCINNRIPLFIIGQPGTSKSCSLSIILNNALGSRAPNPFLAQYQIFQVFFLQCTEYTTTSSIQQIFQDANDFEKSVGRGANSLIVLDEVGLMTKNDQYALQVLHSLLAEKPYKSLIALSNWPFDAAKMNRAITLLREAPDDNELRKFCRKTVEMFRSSVFSEITSDLIDIFIHLYRSVTEETKQTIFGLRDFYCLIVGVKSILAKNLTNTDFQKEIIYQLLKCFGGPDSKYAKNIDFSKYQMPFIQGKTPLFKDKLVDIINQPRFYINAEYMIERNLKQSYDRHIMIVDSSNISLNFLRGIIFQKLEFPIDKIVFFEMSQLGDTTEESKFIYLEKIKDCMKFGNILILQNMSILHKCLYDVLNQQPLIIGENYYARIIINDHNQYCEIHPEFRIILLTEPSEMMEFSPPFIQRFQKLYIKNFSSTLKDSNFRKKITSYITNQLGLNIEEFLIESTSLIDILSEDISIKSCKADDVLYSLIDQELIPLCSRKQIVKFLCNKERRSKFYESAIDCRFKSLEEIVSEHIVSTDHNAYILATSDHLLPIISQTRLKDTVNEDMLFYGLDEIPSEKALKELIYEFANVEAKYLFVLHQLRSKNLQKYFCYLQRLYDSLMFDLISQDYDISSKKIILVLGFPSFTEISVPLSRNWKFLYLDHIPNQNDPFSLNDFRNLDISPFEFLKEKEIDPISYICNKSSFEISNKLWEKATIEQKRRLQEVHNGIQQIPKIPILSNLLSATTLQNIKRTKDWIKENRLENSSESLYHYLEESFQHWIVSCSMPFFESLNKQGQNLGTLEKSTYSLFLKFIEMENENLSALKDNSMNYSHANHFPFSDYLYSKIRNNKKDCEQTFSDYKTRLENHKKFISSKFGFINEAFSKYPILRDQYLQDLSLILTRNKPKHIQERIRLHLQDIYSFKLEVMHERVFNCLLEIGEIELFMGPLTIEEITIEALKNIDCNLSNIDQNLACFLKKISQLVFFDIIVTISKENQTQAKKRQRVQTLQHSLLSLSLIIQNSSVIKNNAEMIFILNLLKYFSKLSYEFLYRYEILTTIIRDIQIPSDISLIVQFSQKLFDIISSISDFKLFLLFFRDFLIPLTRSLKKDILIEFTKKLVLKFIFETVLFSKEIDTLEIKSLMLECYKSELLSIDMDIPIPDLSRRVSIEEILKQRSASLFSDIIEIIWTNEYKFVKVNNSIDFAKFEDFLIINQNKWKKEIVTELSRDIEDKLSNIKNAWNYIKYATFLRILVRYSIPLLSKLHQNRSFKKIIKHLQYHLRHSSDEEFEEEISDKEDSKNESENIIDESEEKILLTEKITKKISILHSARILMLTLLYQRISASQLARKKRIYSKVFPWVNFYLQSLVASSSLPSFEFILLYEKIDDKNELSNVYAHFQDIQNSIDPSDIPNNPNLLYYVLFRELLKIHNSDLDEAEEIELEEKILNSVKDNNNNNLQYRLAISLSEDKKFQNKDSLNIIIAQLIWHFQSTYSSSNSFFNILISNQETINVLNEQWIPTMPMDAIEEIMENRKQLGITSMNRCACGYTYAIGDCGMAMQSTACPNCGGVIGGADHSLHQGNQRITHDNNFRSGNSKGYKIGKDQYSPILSDTIRSLQPLSLRILRILINLSLYSSSSPLNKIVFFGIKKDIECLSQIINSDLEDTSIFLHYIINCGYLFPNNNLSSYAARNQFEEKFNSEINSKLKPQLKKKITEWKEYNQHFIPPQNKSIELEEISGEFDYSNLPKHLRKLRCIHLFSPITREIIWPHFQAKINDFLQKNDLKDSQIAPTGLVLLISEDWRDKFNALNLLPIFIEFQRELVRDFSLRYSKEEIIDEKMEIPLDLKNRPIFHKFVHAWNSVIPLISNFQCQQNISIPSLSDDVFLSFFLLFIRI